MIWKSDLAKRCTVWHCIIPLDLASGSGSVTLGNQCASEWNNW